MASLVHVCGGCSLTEADGVGDSLWTEVWTAVSVSTRTDSVSFRGGWSSARCVGFGRWSAGEVVCMCTDSLSRGRSDVLDGVYCLDFVLSEAYPLSSGSAVSDVGCCASRESDEVGVETVPR